MHEECNTCFELHKLDCPGISKDKRLNCYRFRFKDIEPDLLKLSARISHLHYCEHMKNLLQKCTEGENGIRIIPEVVVSEIMYNMNNSFVDLSEKEQSENKNKGYEFIDHLILQRKKDG